MNTRWGGVGGPIDVGPRCVHRGLNRGGAAIETTALEVALAFVAGTALGCVYFAGLWLTVRQIPDARHPQALLVVSFVVRVAVLLGGFYLVMQASWERVVACLLGFLVARTGMVGYARYQIKTDDRRNNEKESS